MEYRENFKALIKTFLRHGSKNPETHPAIISQFILESARGASNLATEHNNFAGMKWREELKKVAKKALVQADTETSYFCSFDSLDNFVLGYWIFLSRKPYEGWEDHANTAEDFIEFVAPIWAADPLYADKLTKLLGEARELIEQFEGGYTDTDDIPCCDGMANDDILTGDPEKPPTEWISSPFNYSRRGTKIDTIVMHYTTSRSQSGTISWFQNKSENVSEVAAHYVIGRDGRIVQMVNDMEACTHGNSQNLRSIGIEHSAAPGDAMTKAQEASSIALIRWLMREYGVSRHRIIGHKCAPRSTKCPGDLFKHYGATYQSDCKAVTKAIQAWLDDKLLS